VERYQTPIEVQAARGRIKTMITLRENLQNRTSTEEAELFALRVALQAMMQVKRVLIRSKRAEVEPLPFKVDVALYELQQASGGRFKATTPAKAAIAIQKLIRRYPDIATWQRIGEWLGAGGEAYRGDLDSRAVTASNLDAWAAHSQTWVENGRPALTGAVARRGFVPQQDQVQLDKDVYADDDVAIEPDGEEAP
jgi:hypothetical protein